MTQLLRYDWLLLLLAAPCVGSFLGVVVARLPAGRPVLWARSACPHCGRGLGWRDLIPVVSWLIARGACRHCGRALSAFYPLIEIAALGVALWSIAVVPGWPAWASCALGWALLGLGLIDARHLFLPDEITLPLVPAGLAVAWALDADTLADHALAAAAGFVLVVAIGWAHRRLRRREGIGLGDAKLFAAAGAWVGWSGLPGILLLSAAGALAWHVGAALLTGRGVLRRELPYGPFIAGALWIVWLYGPLVAG